MKIAEPLLIERNRVRFRSLVNGRIFSMVFLDSFYDLVELESNEPMAWARRFLYQGTDALEVMRIILKEVRDVRA